MNVSLIYLYYNNLDAINNLKLNNVNRLPFRKIFIDDASAEPLELDSSWTNTLVVRMLNDVQWNMSNANNVAVSFVDTEFFVRMDIDHFFDNEEIIDFFSSYSLPDNSYKQFKRPHKNRLKVKFPPNIILMKTQDFISLGGYDERFCGYYGYEDMEFIRRLDMSGYKCIRDEKPYIYTSSCSTQGLDRSLDRNFLLFETIKNTGVPL